MAGPPENVDATDLWLQLTKIPRPSKVVDLPRNYPGTKKPIGQVRIRPLTQEEQMICNAEADRYTKALLKDSQKRDEANLGYENTFANDLAIQVLFRACRDVNDDARAAFPSTKGMRTTFTTDEIGALFVMYMTVQLELGPIITEMSAEEMEAWVRRIEEGGSAFPFDLLSPEMQRTLLRSMASRLVSFWTATSSAGLPLVGTPSETDPTEAPDDGEPLTAPE